MSKIFIPKRASGSSTMSPALPGAKNYFQWIVSEIEPYLGTHILDIGSGYGIHLEYILPQHPHITATDLSFESVQALRQKFYACSAFEARQIDFEKASDCESLLTHRFDTIICFNVLEHLQDDIAALRQMHEILQQQRGIVLLMVPAHQWLYGSMDRQAGHFRRYTTTSLGSKLQKVGFEILYLRYFNAFGVLPWFINNRIFNKELDGSGVDLQIKIFDTYIVPVIRRLESRMKLPIGQSIISVARVYHD
ncbi:MAG: class I SAM-dependent methyltransferase [Desulfobacula sp.]|nr:class I SAM-dependent methyltransferase [Desulfobacula sp.]